MATTKGIAAICKIFTKDNLKPIKKSSYGLWVSIFSEVSDENLRKGALYLIENRTGRWPVGIGELKKALSALDISLTGHEPGEEVTNNPMEDIDGISMREWLDKEGFETWEDAVKECGE